MALLRTLRCPRGAISTTSMYQYQGSAFDHDLIAGSLSRLLSFNCSVNCFPPFRFAAQNYPVRGAAGNSITHKYWIAIKIEIIRSSCWVSKFISRSVNYSAAFCWTWCRESGFATSFLRADLLFLIKRISSTIDSFLPEWVGPFDARKEEAKTACLSAKYFEYIDRWLWSTVVISTWTNEIKVKGDQKWHMTRSSTLPKRG